jgi:hypothetical protein
LWQGQNFKPTHFVDQFCGMAVKHKLRSFFMRIANVPVIVSLAALVAGCSYHEPHAGYAYNSTPAHAGEAMTARARADLYRRA